MTSILHMFGIYIVIFTADIGGCVILVLGGTRLLWQLLIIYRRKRLVFDLD